MRNRFTFAANYDHPGVALVASGLAVIATTSLVATTLPRIRQLR